MAVIGRRWTRYLPRRRSAGGAVPAAAPVRPDRFGIAVEAAGAATVVAVTGDVDIATAPQLRAALADAASPLVIDLGGVTFMDSTGLAILLRAARDRGRELAIACPEGPARLLFAVTATEAELPLHASRDEALRALGG